MADETLDASLSTTSTSLLKVSEIDDYKDKLHRLELAYKALKTQTDNEIEYHKDEIEIHQKTIEGLQKEKNEFVHHNKRLNSECDEVREQLAEKITENKKLQTDLEKQLKLNAKSNSLVLETPANIDEIEIYKTANSELKAKLKHLESSLLSQSVQINNQEAQIKQCNQIIEHLRESLEVKNDLILELNDKIRTQEEMYSENLNAAMQSNTDSLDDQRRGNSLFSELDSRRVKVEEELKRLRERVETLTAENIKLRTRIGKGDHVNSVVLTQLQAVTKSQDTVQKEINKWRSEALDKFETFSNRCIRLREEYQSKLTKYSYNVDPTDVKVTEERDQLLLQNMSLNKEILELKRELKINQHLKVEAEASTVINVVRKNNNRSESQSPNNTLNGNTTITGRGDGPIDSMNESSGNCAQQ